jgi:nitrogen-specific signal transduction histidine kinase
VDYSINPSEIYGWKGKHSLIKLNHQLETILEVETPFQDLRTLFIEDLDADGDQEIFCQSGDLLLAFNGELDLLGSFLKAAPGANHTFRFTGPDNPIELGVQSGQNFYHLEFSHNKLHSYLPLFFVGLFVFIFLIFTAGNRFFLTLNIYLKFFRFFFYDLSDSILIIDFQGKIRYTNANFKRLLDLPHQPARGENFTSVLKPYPKILLLINKSFENNEAFEQTVLIDNQESRREVNIIVEPFRFFLKSGVSYLVKFSDASFGSTSQKIQTWSRAVQKMAHDIKTPLSTVSLNLKVLQTSLEKIPMSDSEQKELSDDITMIRTELENIQKMTRNFIKFSNLDSPHFQIFDLRDTIKEAVSKYQAYLSDDLDIQISIDEDIKPVWADPQQVEFILHILLENALAAIKGKGLISINISLAQYLDEQFAEYLEIEIADSGPGIPEIEKNRIFEPYFTTKSNGTGMGLAIAKKIIEDHHGSIEVHSKSGFGAVFRFSLPVAKEEELNV